MATLIAPADFKGENNIPDKDLVGENLQGFIDKYEAIFLKKLMGADLYTVYLATPTNIRFTNLMQWVKPAEIDYVYWFWMQDQQIQTLGTGTGQTKKQNAITATPWPKMVRAWNEMVGYNKEFNKYVDDNKLTYPEYTVYLPFWYYRDGCYLMFDWLWYWGYGCNQIPDIYQLKNRLGI